MIDVNMKYKSMHETLKTAQQHLLNQDATGKNIGEQSNFLETLKKVKDYIDKIKY